MIQGQAHDMRQDVVVAATAEERLSRCFRLKSASLYGAAAKMGGILTGADDAEEFQARSLAHLERFGAEADWLRCLVCEASWKAS